MLSVPSPVSTETLHLLKMDEVIQDVNRIKTNQVGENRMPNVEPSAMEESCATVNSSGVSKAEEESMSTVPVAVSEPQESPLIHLFRKYSQTLDRKNDKYERIYKTSRDITTRSKRIIFSLHRYTGLSEGEREDLLRSAGNDLRELEQTLLKNIAMELRDEDPYQFANAYTGGLQEYIESVTFYHFMQTGTIMGHNTVQQRVTYGGKELEQDTLVPLSVLVRPKEYLLGIADLTGELMRLCIKSVSSGDCDRCYHICDVLKGIHAGFLSLGYIPAKELYHKMTTFRSSLHKVEEACYSLQLRQYEVPSHMLGDVFAMYDADDAGGSSFM